jgi:hypothetical protein
MGLRPTLRIMKARGLFGPDRSEDEYKKKFED